MPPAARATSSPNRAQPVVAAHVRSSAHKHVPSMASPEPAVLWLPRLSESRGPLLSLGEKLVHSMERAPRHAISPSFRSFRLQAGKSRPTWRGKVTEPPDCLCPIHAGRNGLLTIDGKRIVILLAASRVINQLHRALAAFSRSGTCRPKSYLTVRPGVSREVSLLGKGHPNS